MQPVRTPILTTVPIKDLRPTQITVGMREVEAKRQRDEQVYNKLSTRVEMLQSRLSKAEAEATIDPVTRVMNRGGFDRAIQRAVATAEQSQAPLTLVMVDIDHFKTVNDTHGHAIGDEVLIAVAKTLRDSIRRSDMVARMGGEEFCVLQTDIDSELMTMLTERLRAAVEAIAEPVRITASFGVCHSSKTIEPTALLQHADQALYAAKRDGRNRVVVA